MSQQPKFNYAAAAKAKQQQREMTQLEKQPPTQPRWSETKPAVSGASSASAAAPAASQAQPPAQAPQAPQAPSQPKSAAAENKAAPAQQSANPKPKKEFNPHAFFTGGGQQSQQQQQPSPQPSAPAQKQPAPQNGNQGTQAANHAARNSSDSLRTNAQPFNPQQQNYRPPQQFQPRNVSNPSNPSNPQSRTPQSQQRSPQPHHQQQLNPGPYFQPAVSMACSKHILTNKSAVRRRILRPKHAGILRGSRAASLGSIPSAHATNKPIRAASILARQQERPVATNDPNHPSRSFLEHLPKTAIHAFR